MLYHVIARSTRDEAIQGGASDWIASLHFVALAMTSRSRGAAERPSYAKHCRLLVTTGLDPVVHAEDQQASAGG